MKNPLLTLAFLLVTSAMIQAQVLFEENFDSGSMPDGWTVQTSATDGGWNVGSAVSLSSQSWGITNNGSAGLAATNDDACNCNKSNDLFITPRMDFTGQSSLVLKFDAFYGDNSYQGNQENATILVSLDSINWQEINDLGGNGSWTTNIIDLSAFAGEDTVFIGFKYDDGGGWLYGFALDNVSIEVPLSLDAEMVEVESRSFGEEFGEFPIKGTIFNNGISAITTLEIGYTVNGGPALIETLDNLNIAPFSYYAFETGAPWVPVMAGQYNVDISILSVNGGDDEDLTNNGDSFDTEIFAKVVPPNKIEDFLMAAPVVTEVANASDQLNKPTDLDFFPILGLDQLWVINQRNENSGGSTLTISDASADTPSDFLSRSDGNAWHFMSLPTGIAFSSDNFNFASSPGIKDANHSGGTFTGPTLWSSDPAIYAQPSGGNGSHLDMLHGSPFSMGIAHEVDNAFWVYDDWNKDIVRYDFAHDHGPGNADHDDGIVRRYKNIGIDADGDVPNHMILDKATGWLYFVDNGNDRVMRLDINSGTVSNNLPFINETLAEHSQMGNFTVETIIDSGLDRPCGIEIMENRLLVGDYATGEIIVFDMDNSFMELGRIPTGETGLTGIKVGPDGNIWYTNRLQNSLSKAKPGDPNSTEEEALSALVKIFPNPTSGSLLISLPEAARAGEVEYKVSDMAGKTCFTAKGDAGMNQIDLGDLANGMYLMTIRTDSFSATRKVVVER